MRKLRVLVFDIETAPMLVHTWGIRDQYIDIDQIERDWYVIAWAAKWLGEPAASVIYRDQRDAKNVEDDKAILKDLWKLLDEADIVITQNGKMFDSRKLNARFITHGMRPPSPYKHLDTYLIIKRVAAFSSNKLAFLSEKLCTKYKKLKHKKFPGLKLWRQCMAGNRAAWAEMKLYNIHDVLATEEFYTKIQAWDSSIDFNIYGDFTKRKCNCGSTQFTGEGYSYTAAGKYQRYKCKRCGKWTASKENLLTKTQRKELRKSAGAQ